MIGLPQVRGPEEVAVLCRQSTGKEKQEHSNEKQFFCVNEWCERVGVPFPTSQENHYEAIVSGLSDSRPELDRLLRDVESGRRKLVLMYHVSRMARLAINSLEFIERVGEADVPLGISAEGRFFDLNNPNDRLDIQFKIMAAEAENTERAVMVRQGAHRKARLGLWPAAAPSGFRRLKSGLLVPHEDTGRSLESALRVAAVLGLRGVVKAGLGSSRSTVHYWARSPAYEGTLSYARTYFDFAPDPTAGFADRPKRGRFSRPDDQQILVPNAILSPVNPALLLELRQRLDRRRYNKDGSGVRWKQRDPFCFAAVAHCGLCGQRIRRRIARNGSRKRYEYVGCQTKDCANRYVAREIWEKSVLQAVERLSREQKGVEGILHKAARERLEELRPRIEAAKAEMLVLCRRKREMICSMSSRLTGDPVVFEVYQSLVSKILEHVTLLRQASWLRLHATAESAAAALREQVKGFAERWETMTPVERFLLVRHSFRAIAYHSPSTIEFSPQLSCLAVR